MVLALRVWLGDATGTSELKKRIAKPAALYRRERMSDALLELILLLFRGGEKKIESSKRMDGFAWPRRFDLALTGANRLDRFDEPRKHVWQRDGNVVRAEDEFQLRSE